MLIAPAASFCVSLQPAEVLKVFCQQALWSDFFPLQQLVQFHAQTWSWARSCSAVLLCFVSVFSLQLLFFKCLRLLQIGLLVFCVLVSSVPFLSVCASGSRVLCVSCISRVFPAWQRCFCFGSLVIYAKSPHGCTLREHAHDVVFSIVYKSRTRASRECHGKVWWIKTNTSYEAHTNL